MDRQTARGLVALKIEDPSQTQFTADQYNTAIELAEQQFCLDARAIMTSVTKTVTSGVPTIGLPSDFLVAILVRHLGIKLKPITQYELSFQSGADWTVVNGTPRAFWINDETEELNLVPIPQSADSGDVLVIDYVSSPTPAPSDSSNLLNQRTILQQYVPAVIAFAAREMLTYKPITNEAVAKMAVLLKEYQRYTEACITTYKNMSDEPLRMQGGRNWNDGSVRSPDAFSDNY